ncbi:hypothetical protein GE21DRAFT_1007045 [Neurospora crassa]|nr:hypothetical protein GE21DRAFT_1007045 [Neurospora crassa]
MTPALITKGKRRSTYVDPKALSTFKVPTHLALFWFSIFSCLFGFSFPFDTYPNHNSPTIIRCNHSVIGSFSHWIIQSFIQNGGNDSEVWHM